MHHTMRQSELNRMNDPYHNQNQSYNPHMSSHMPPQSHQNELARTSQVNHNPHEFNPHLRQENEFTKYSSMHPNSNVEVYNIKNPQLQDVRYANQIPKTELKTDQF